MVTTEEVKKTHLAQQKRLYEAGDKAGKLLAWLGSKEREGLQIRKLTLETGEVLTKDSEIAPAFANYMTDFYTSKEVAPDEEMLDFVRDCRPVS